LLSRPARGATFFGRAVGTWPSFSTATRTVSAALAKSATS
jgi:hypothetical protein